MSAYVKINLLLTNSIHLILFSLKMQSVKNITSVFNLSENKRITNTAKNAIPILRKKILKTSKRLSLLSNILLVRQISHFLLTKNLLSIFLLEIRNVFLEISTIKIFLC